MPAIRVVIKNCFFVPALPRGCRDPHATIASGNLLAAIKVKKVRTGGVLFRAFADTEFIRDEPLIATARAYACSSVTTRSNRFENTLAVAG